MTNIILGGILGVVLTMAVSHGKILEKILDVLKEIRDKDRD